MWEEIFFPSLMGILPLAPEESAVLGLAFCLDAQGCLARVVVKRDFCFAFFIQLEVWIPIKRSAIVFLAFWQFVLAVVGMIHGPVFWWLI